MRSLSLFQKKELHHYPVYFKSKNCTIRSIPFILSKATKSDIQYLARSRFYSTCNEWMTIPTFPFTSVRFPSSSSSADKHTEWAFPFSLAVLYRVSHARSHSRSNANPLTLRLAAWRAARRAPGWPPGATWPPAAWTFRPRELEGVNLRNRVKCAVKFFVCELGTCIN